MDDARYKPPGEQRRITPNNDTIREEKRGE
jgi:hypothetical protein